MSLADDIANTPRSEPAGKGSIDVTPDGASVNNVVVTSPILDDWAPVFALFNLNADEFEVVDDTVRMSTWQQSARTKDGDRDIIQLYSYNAKFMRRRSRISVEDLLSATVDVKPVGDRSAGAAAFVLATGDWQLGKADGDGATGTVARIRRQIALAAEAFHSAKDRHNIGHLHLALLGDHVEGGVSQGGRNMWRTELTITEQQQLYRRLITEAVRTLAPLAETMTIAAVPGNHGDAIRQPVGTRADDNWDVDGLIAVSEALAFNPDAFGHVECIVSARDEVDVCIDLAGTRIGHTHGHMMRPGKHWDWWKGQAFGGSDLAEADILLAGHLHHLHLEENGDRLFCQVPSLESESTWYRHRTGERGKPGMVSMIVHDRSWHEMAVIN
ncbi:hypothetical protein GS534_00570 [Rhodococcus hoagii]|nr:hypothetical protein [Prescottella equi]